MQHELASLMASTEYKALVRARSRIVWPMVSLAIAAYLGFILIIAFAPAILRAPIVEGRIISVGIVSGFGLILFNIVLTLIYVRIANRRIEPLVKLVQAKGAK